MFAAVAVLSWRSHPAMLSEFTPHHLPDMDAKRRIVGSVPPIQFRASISYDLCLSYLVAP